MDVTCGKMSSSWLHIVNRLRFFLFFIWLTRASDGGGGGGGGVAAAAAAAANNGSCEPDYSMSMLSYDNLRAATSSLVQTLVPADDSIPLHQDIQFWCIKPGMNDFQQIFVDQTTDGIVDEDLPISFVVHGYLASIQNSPWMERTARVWITNHHRIVCLVDWRRLAAFSYLVASRKHTQVVGLYMAKLMGSLPLSRLKEISIVGHSLGAHVAGYCGKALNGSIGIIYGLDPAGPLFTFPFPADPDRRLNASDAHHVQCLHTDRGAFGTSDTCGDSDYYANLGYRQPGCLLHRCNHIRAVYIFEASLHQSNAFMGRECPDDRRAFINRCHDNIDRFGVYGNHSNGRFYFRTTDCYPYCWNCAAKKENRSS